MTDKDKKGYQIYITAEVMKRFKHLCVDKGINASQMIESLMLEALEKNKQGHKK